MTDLELDWFYNGGAGMFFPEKWKILLGYYLLKNEII